MDVGKAATAHEITQLIIITEVRFDHVEPNHVEKVLFYGQRVDCGQIVRCLDRYGDGAVGIRCGIIGRARVIDENLFLRRQRQRGRRGGRRRGETGRVRRWFVVVRTIGIEAFHDRAGRTLLVGIGGRGRRRR